MTDRDRDQERRDYEQYMDEVRQANTQRRAEERAAADERDMQLREHLRQPGLL